MKTGVLLFNLGGPERLSDVRPFLYKLFSDPEIIRVKFTPLRKAIAFTIATLRHKKSEGYYAQIGGGSPLRRLTEEQAASLERELRQRGSDAEVFVGMVTWHPFFEETLGKIEKAGLDRLIILPLFPQFSVTTTGFGLCLVKEPHRKASKPEKASGRLGEIVAGSPAIYRGIRRLVQRELAKFTDPGKVHLVFSAHSIPESYVRNGDPYLDQTKQSMEGIMDRLGRQNTYELAFQSKIGPVKWLEPSTNDVIKNLGKRGVHDVLVIPISFVSEHIETLYELDILYKHVAEDSGVTNLRRVGALNSDPAFIKALAEIVENCPI